jgi:hypothetical protein
MFALRDMFDDGDNKTEHPIIFILQAQLKLTAGPQTPPPHEEFYN